MRSSRLLIASGMNLQFIEPESSRMKKMLGLTVAVVALDSGLSARSVNAPKLGPHDSSATRAGRKRRQKRLAADRNMAVLPFSTVWSG